MMGGGGGGGSEAAPAQQPAQPAQYQQDPNNPCAMELKQFLDCASNQSDISLCYGFNEALKQCKQQYGMYLK